MKSLVLCDNTRPEVVLSLCKKYNVGIEIQGFYDPNTTDRRDGLVAHHKNLLPVGIEKYMHAPFWDLCLGSANKKIAEVTRYYFDYAYGVAAELGCAGIVVHHGFVPNTSHPSSWIKRSIGFWNGFFDAHDGDIGMYMENLLETSPEILSDVVDGCANARLGVNLDIGHAHFIGNLPVTEWVKRLGSRIAYVHLHQNHGEKDEHLGLRKGNMPLRDVLDALNEHAPGAVWALECDLEDMEESVCLLGELGYIKV